MNAIANDKIRGFLSAIHRQLGELRDAVLEVASPTTIDDTYEIDSSDPTIADALDLLIAADYLAYSPYGPDWYEVTHTPGKPGMATVEELVDAIAEDDDDAQ